MKLSEIKKKFKREWVLLEVLKENELGETIEARVLAHSKDRDEVYKVLSKVKKGN